MLHTAMRAENNPDSAVSIEKSIMGSSPGIRLKSQLLTRQVPQVTTPKRKINYVMRNKSVAPTTRKLNIERSGPLYDEAAEQRHLKAISSHVEKPFGGAAYVTITNTASKYYYPGIDLKTV